MSKETNHSKALKAAREILVESEYRVVKDETPMNIPEIAAIIDKYFPAKQRKTKKTKPTTPAEVSN